MSRERCEKCPLNELDSAISVNPILTRALDLDFALDVGVQITLDDIDCEEWRALKTLREERNKYQEERIKREKQKR
jgi:hypothetical protein